MNVGIKHWWLLTSQKVSQSDIFYLLVEDHSTMNEVVFPQPKSNPSLIKLIGPTIR